MKRILTPQERENLILRHRKERDKRTCDRIKAVKEIAAEMTTKNLFEQFELAFSKEQQKNVGRTLVAQLGFFPAPLQDLTLGYAIPKSACKELDQERGLAI